jgi:hypothetical protein
MHNTTTFSKAGATQHTATANAQPTASSAPQAPMEANPVAANGFGGIGEDVCQLSTFMAYKANLSFREIRAIALNLRELKLMMSLRTSTLTRFSIRMT